MKMYLKHFYNLILRGFHPTKIKNTVLSRIMNMCLKHFHNRILDNFLVSLHISTVNIISFKNFALSCTYEHVFKTFS